MDYFGILKKAWNITWKYKALWVLGLFAGASSSGNSNTSSYQQNSDQVSGVGDQFASWVSENVVLIAVVVGAFVVIGFLFWVLSVAAQGGLVHGANVAAQDQKPSLRECWSVGFSKWGRTFMIGLVLGTPAVILVLLMVVLIVGMVGGGALLGSTDGSESAGAGAALGAVGGLCFVLPLFIVLIIALSLIIGITYQLALRYGVIEDVTFGQAIKRGWDDLWGKRGAFVMWLVMILPGIAASMVMLLVMLPFLAPAVAFALTEKYVMAGGFILLAALITMLPTAIYGTFVSSAWTVFFRQMTGLEPKGGALPAPSPYVPPIAPPVSFEPAAPPAYAPPAPPVAPAPEAAPAVEEAPPADA